MKTPRDGGNRSGMGVMVRHKDAGKQASKRPTQFKHRRYGRGKNAGGGGGKELKNGNKNKEKKKKKGPVAEKAEVVTEAASLMKRTPKHATPLLSKVDIPALPVVGWDGKVRILDTVGDMQDAVNEILASPRGDDDGGGGGNKNKKKRKKRSERLVLGFDTETKPTFRKGERRDVALVQIATCQCVYLFRLCELRLRGEPSSSLLDPLLPLLCSEDIVKAGIGVLGDIVELQRIQPFQAMGFVDIASDITMPLLRYEHKSSHPNQKPTAGGLLAVFATFFRQRISKAEQMSNWERRPCLTPRQVRYAATDAWVGRILCLRAMEEVQKLQ